jgi:DNA (cytosine-5)-methyltransferase 1
MNQKNYELANESSNVELRELALFAGAGGGILGGHLLGWRTVCAVEWDAYAASVLVARQNDGCLPPFPIWDNVQNFDGRPWRDCVDIVSGGFPCQDISTAGKGAGITGERSGMWKHMARIIGEVRPRFAFVENSPALTSRGLGTVLGDLAALGYDAQWGVLGADDAGAPHRRKRIWIRAELADTGRKGLPTRRFGSGQKTDGEILNMRTANSGEALANAAGSQDHAQRGDCECGRNAMGWNQEASQRDQRAPDNNVPCRCGSTLADTANHGTGWWEQQPQGGEGSRHVADADLPQREGVRCASGGESEHAITRSLGAWWRHDPAETPESGVGRMAHGVANRVDRLRCIGNGQVPAVVKLAWKTLS